MKMNNQCSLKRFKKLLCNLYAHQNSVLEFMGNSGTKTQITVTHKHFKRGTEGFKNFCCCLNSVDW